MNWKYIGLIIMVIAIVLFVGLYDRSLLFSPTSEGSALLKKSSVLERVGVQEKSADEIIVQKGFTNERVEKNYVMVSVERYIYNGEWTALGGMTRVTTANLESTVGSKKVILKNLAGDEVGVGWFNEIPFVALGSGIGEEHVAEYDTYQDKGFLVFEFRPDMQPVYGEIVRYEGQLWELRSFINLKGLYACVPPTGICNAADGENYLTCPADCSFWEDDGMCPPDASVSDGQCDPDCGSVYASPETLDPDCTLPEPRNCDYPFVSYCAHDAFLYHCVVDVNLHEHSVYESTCAYGCDEGASTCNALPGSSDGLAVDCQSDGDCRPIDRGDGLEWDWTCGCGGVCVKGGGNACCNDPKLAIGGGVAQ